MAARRSRSTRRRRRGRFGGLYKLLSVLLILAAIFAGCAVFFRVDTVLVEGNQRYDDQEVITASEVQRGDNLFTLNKSAMLSRILTRLPYVDDLSIRRKLPDTLVFYVTEGTAVAWVESGGTCWLLDKRCKVLEAGDTGLAGELPQVLGLTPIDPTVGSRLTVGPEEGDKLEQLRAFLGAMADRGMTGSLTGFLDVSRGNELRFGYGAELTVLFPLNGDFTEKTHYLRQTLLAMDERGIPRTGTLDLTYDTQEAHLLPERWLPENWSAPAPEESGPVETAPAETGQPEPEESAPAEDPPEESASPEPPAQASPPPQASIPPQAVNGGAEQGDANGNEETAE